MAASLTLQAFELLYKAVRLSRREFGVTLRLKKRDPLAEILRSQHEEIKKYKWIESEKAGQDIGWERAIREWMSKHFPDWKRFRWERALKDAIRFESPKPAKNRLN
jgi:hypothetical protein